MTSEIPVIPYTEGHTCSSQTVSVFWTAAIVYHSRLLDIYLEYVSHSVSVFIFVLFSNPRHFVQLDK